MDLTSLSNLVPTEVADTEGSQGKPLDIPLDRIITGDNPRTKFDEQYLERLAASIKARGVKSPISVKRISPEEVRAWFAEQGAAPPPVLEGFFQINHGECRYRASSIAGQPSIPAIIDEHHVRVDALVENIQRQDLDPLDIANAIKWELDHNDGLKKVDIARELGVSGSYVSNHLKLLTLPDPVASMVREGRSKDVTSLIQLASAYQEFPREVSHFCATTDEPTQAVVRQFVAALKEQGLTSPRTDHTPPGEASVSGSSGAAAPTRQDDPDSGAGPMKDGRVGHGEGRGLRDSIGTHGATIESSPNARFTRIEICHVGRAAVLLPKAPTARGLAWIRYDGEAHETQIELRTIEEVVALIIG